MYCHQISLAPLHFNPRSPCGERPLVDALRDGEDAFQSTLPVWGATSRASRAAATSEFQSTLPVWGATLKDRRPVALDVFQSTLPVWGATNWSSIQCFWGNISIHAPRVGSDVEVGTHNCIP